MSMPQAEPTTNTKPALEDGEQKRQVHARPVDESLSEWERARMTSKTWSMEQD
ncbi:MAG: hypothetical protein U5O39_09870 [Gammaproteobacteria bacterium]|nr:hypothetical protein [Gammaproteobacteria bacterium]